MKQITTLLLLCSLQVQRPCDHYHRGADCFSHWELRSRSQRAEVALSPGQLDNHSIERSSLKTIKHDLHQNQDPGPPTGGKKEGNNFSHWELGSRSPRAEVVLSSQPRVLQPDSFNIQFDPFNQVQSNLNSFISF